MLYTALSSMQILQQLQTAIAEADGRCRDACLTAMLSVVVTLEADRAGVTSCMPHRVYVARHCHVFQQLQTAFAARDCLPV